MKGKELPEETRIKISNSLKNHLVSNETRAKISLAQKGKHKNRVFSIEAREKARLLNLGENNPNFGKRASKETREKMSNSRSGEKHPMFGKTHSIDAKRKMRISAIKRIERNFGKHFPSINEKSISFFEEVDKIVGNKGFYGKDEFLIKELGYWPDYINFKSKIIIEWDEEAHFKKKKYLERDNARQLEIQKLFPDFHFSRIRDIWF